MGRPQKPWYRKARKSWFVELDGRQYNLGPDKEEAHKEFHRLMSQPKVKAECVVALLDKFLGSVEKERPKSYAWYKQYLQSFSSAHGLLRTDQLKPFHVRDWANGKRAPMVALKRALNWATEMGHIPYSPIAKLRPPPIGKRERIIPPGELETILASVDLNFGKLIQFVYVSGARPQEAVAAHKRNLQRDRLVWLAGQAPKGKAPRIIYLNEKALRLINDDGYLLTNSRGKRWTSNAVRIRFKRLEAKLGTRYVLYHFRHSFCHNLLAKGTDSLTVSVLMGHKSPAMVASTYSHLNQADDHLRAAVRTL